jgi:hypothetical protein
MIYELYILKTSDYREKAGEDGELIVESGKRKEANRAAPLRKFLEGWLLRADNINGTIVIGQRKDTSDRPLTATLELHHVDIDEESIAAKRNLKRVPDGVDEKGAVKPAQASKTPVWTKTFTTVKGKDGWKVVEVRK